MISPYAVRTFVVVVLLSALIGVMEWVNWLVFRKNLE